MPTQPETAHIFVGSDRSQLLAVKVLEHSIRRHTDMPISVRSMDDLDLPDAKDPRQGKRTGFSFTRFAIPQLMGYQGRAVYLDADMLVFRDFRELWNIPFDGAKIIIQEELSDKHQPHGKAGAPDKRIKQCSVMLLDCEALRDWDPVAIISGLDGKYTYEDLLYHMCVLDESEVKYGVPFVWNSLEIYEPGKTGLIHYTDMGTQPWVCPSNANAWLWLEEVRLMLENGSLSWDELEGEVKLGYFRPSLLTELREAKNGPVQPANRDAAARYLEIDEQAGFQKHAAVYTAKRQRDQIIRNYERQLAMEAGPASAAMHAGATALRKAVSAVRRLVP